MHASTKRIGICLALLVTGVCVYGIVWVARVAQDVDGALARTIVPEFVPSASSPLTATHQDDLAWVYNVIGRRGTWSEKDTARVVEILQTGYPDIPPTYGTDAFEVYDVYMTLVVLVADRMQYDIATPETVKAAFADSLVDGMSSEIAAVREGTAAAAMDSGLFATSNPVSVAVLNLRDDPDASVRFIVSAKLRRLRGEVVEAVPCPTCPDTTP